MCPLYPLYPLYLLYLLFFSVHGSIDCSNQPFLYNFPTILIVDPKDNDRGVIYFSNWLGLSNLQNTKVMYSREVGHVSFNDCDYMKIAPSLIFLNQRFLYVNNCRALSKLPMCVSLCNGVITEDCSNVVILGVILIIET